MQRNEMVRFVLWFLRSYEPAREWGALRSEAEEIVDAYLHKEVA